MALDGADVLVIDLDPQGTATTLLGFVPDAEIEPEGYAQALWSAPIAASVLTALRSEMLRCHLLRERARQASQAQRKQQAAEAVD